MKQTELDFREVTVISEFERASPESMVLLLKHQNKYLIAKLYRK